MYESCDIEYEDNAYLNYCGTNHFYRRSIIELHDTIDEKDYEDAITAYIACPVNQNEYKFSFRSLRAGEKKWLAGLLAIKTNAPVDSLLLRYHIISKMSDGTISGNLEYKATT